MIELLIAGVASTATLAFSWHAYWKGYKRGAEDVLSAWKENLYESEEQ